MEQKEKTKFVIFKQHLAGWLMMRGFVLIGVDRTTQGDKKRNIYLFNETEELHKAINDYKQLQLNNQF